VSDTLSDEEQVLLRIPLNIAVLKPSSAKLLEKGAACFGFCFE
jgi:hypothetical protein